MSTEITAMTARIRELGRGFAQEVAKEARADVLAAVVATAEAGTTPGGAAWAPRKVDGARALANASKHITAAVLGSVVRLTLAYPYSIWHYSGDTPTRPRRQVLPDDGPLPASVEKAISDAAKRVFARRAGP